MSPQSRRWDPFAVLLIDVQNDFWSDEMTDAFPDFERNVGDLLALCRREKIAVVHLRAQFRADQSDWMIRYKPLGRIPCIEGTPGAEIFECAREASGEEVIVKQTFDAFQNPQLEAFLAENGKTHLLVAGLVTSVCVLLTAATAAQKGHLVSVIEDCCADKPEAHKHTLQRYPFIFDRIRVGDIAKMLD